MERRHIAALSWYKTRGAIVGYGLLLWALSYFLALRAIDTGSLGQYFIFFALVIIGLRLFLSGVRHRK